MIKLDQLKEISVPSESKIVMLVLDGLGGLPDPDTGKTELETAITPNLDFLANKGNCGLSTPVSPGITPGSGAGHLALFGYDPLQFMIGRGVLEALGIDFELKENDIPARGNFCTVDDSGIITDRRAGRISTEKSTELCNILNGIKLRNVELFVKPVKEHRFLFVIRGNGLSADISDTDPQKTGLPPLKCNAKSESALYTSNIVNEFIDKAKILLSKHRPANMFLLRGFDKKPHIQTFSDIYKLNPAAIAVYPMYRGLARLVGMKIYQVEGSISDQIKAFKSCYNEHDFFFIHVKKTDSAGEDGDFNRKVQVIEEVDSIIPQIMDMKPDVIVVAGDHSTPATLKGHSWHPVPFLLYSKWCRPDKIQKFSESGCTSGSLGTFPALEIMPMALGHAMKLIKFGA
jgi:2,3-bisphosphoglycerate-independent phosphoglycerate mutase